MASTAQTVLPRWRGFNLLEMFTLQSPGRFVEDDFRWMAEWGFDFVRLPMDYRWWAEPDDLMKLKAPALAEIDRAVELGRQHGIHVCLNFHRAPGYCVNKGQPEPFDLWQDAAAVEVFCHHWREFARRYRGIGSAQLSFNLVNEPADESPGKMTRQDYRRVMAAACGAIGQADPDRLIIVDGIAWGNKPCPELTDLHVAQSCRAYQPMQLTHYKAPWVAGERFGRPTYPLAIGEGAVYGRRQLEELYGQWAELARQGVGVHCGEGGSYCFTPHEVFLPWLRDVLEILKSHNIGWAMWNFRGAFGVLDSGRQDVAYEDFRGHKLDRAMLELLRAQ